MRVRTLTLTAALMSSLLLPAACGEPGAGSGADPSTTARASSTTTTPLPPPPPAELPRGGREVFPAYRLVGYAGHPGSAALGRLGVGDLNDRVTELEKAAKPYAAGRRVMPVLELIATVVQGSPGRDGKYRVRGSDAVIARYLNVARRHRAMLLLDIQPGRAGFLEEVKHYQKWLVEPDVGLALDPEWRMGPGEVPMRRFGHTTGVEINSVTAYVASLVAREDLPEKVVVFHQLTARIVRGQSAIVARPGVALVKSVDGIGSRRMKIATWDRLTPTMPAGVHPGFKLFFDEDRELGPLMSPAQVLALRPQPEYVMFE